MTDQARLDS